MRKVLAVVGVCAAQALGGRNRILAVKTIQVIGYGQLAYFNGGSNITGSPDAPQKWQDINDYQRTIDLEHGRMRTRGARPGDQALQPAAVG